MSFNLRSPLVALCVLLPLSACATVRQDQLGVKTRFGRVTSGPLQPGAQFVVPGVSSIIRVPARVVNREVRLEMPTREGLNVSAEVSILYRVKPDQVAEILATSGVEYEDDVIIPVFRSAAADVSARYMAKDMHSGTRAGIEGEIRTQMMSVLESRGFEVQNVLLKSIRLPPDLARAIEEKLEAEQRSEQMRFVLDRERQEAERRTIEATGIRDSWAIIAQGLTPTIITYQSIEAFRELARSPNAKVIVTDGKAPFLITDEAAATSAGSAGGSAVDRPSGGSSSGTSSSGTATRGAAIERLVRPGLPAPSMPRVP